MNIAKCKLEIGKTASPLNILHFALPILHFTFLSLGLPTPFCQAAPAPATTNSQTSLANAFANLIENAIPREYEKRKNWGDTKNITVGLRAEGLKIRRRKKPVKHGVWKHYKIRLIEPQETLAVQIENLRPVEGGRVAFTLAVQAKFDLWARAKVYRYGIHLLALEALGDATIDLEIDCEIGMRFQTHEGSTGLAIDPQVTDARLDITDFHLRRVSNAKGPIIRELGEELPRMIERELQGPKLVAKLNRAIEKNRDRLEMSF
ncbi:MAG: hypothetical protein GXP24_10140 [Planctomycetes bacterium]|nr:hypothetical protein [Planctomycetota bacterium]